MAAIGKSDLLTPEGHRGHRRSPASKRPMKSHMLNRMMSSSSRSAQWMPSYRMAAIGKSDLLTPEGHRGHPGSPASIRLMKSHMLNRMTSSSFRSAQ